MNFKEDVDEYTEELLDFLYAGKDQEDESGYGPAVQEMLVKARSGSSVQDIVDLFLYLKQARLDSGLSPDCLGLARSDAVGLAVKHQDLDEHRVSLGGRVDQAASIVQQAGDMVKS